ncbi:MAG: TolC family protein [Desulfuromonadales bacterium]|nr:TolC family protein [Desulfuromonadales bacterium]
MFAKTRFVCGAALGLLCFATPALQAEAAEPVTAAIFPSPMLSAFPAETELSLREVLNLSLQSHPELSAYAAESRARAAEISQTARFINPELAVEVANVAGSGAYSGFDAAETTLQLSQQIELGNKRQLRRGLAELEHDRALRDLEVVTVEVQARIAKHFWTLLAAQERLKLADEQVAVATATLAVVEEKISAGRAPSVEKYRFQSALAEARLSREQALLAQTAARQTLADHLGLEAAAPSKVLGDLSRLPLLPAYAGIQAQLEKSPEIARRQLESEAKRRDLALTRANRIADPTLALGLRHYQESDDNALIFGFSLPLPLFDRNQGNVQAATHRLVAAQAQEASGLIQSRAGLVEKWQSLAASSAEAQALREQIIPFAQQTYEAASYGYQSGKFGVLEVQDAQRSLVEVRGRYLDVLLTAHLEAVELQQLLGRAPLSTTDQFMKD